MTAPSPNCFRICETARSSAFPRSPAIRAPLNPYPGSLPEIKGRCKTKGLASGRHGATATTVRLYCAQAGRVDLVAKNCIEGADERGIDAHLLHIRTSRVREPSRRRPVRNPPPCRVSRGFEPAFAGGVRHTGFALA